MKQFVAINNQRMVTWSIFKSLRLSVFKFVLSNTATKLRTRVMEMRPWTAVRLHAQPMLSKSRPARLVPRKLPMANAAVQREETRE